MVSVAVALVCGVAAAFDVPCQVRDGVSVSIPGFDTCVGTNTVHGWIFCQCREVCAKDAPLAFSVVLSNRTDQACRGNLNVYLNDDWSVSGPTGRIEVAAQGVQMLDFTARALPRTVNALYPIHAELSLDDGKKCLHPIAIFRTVKTQENLVKKPTPPPKRTAGPLRVDPACVTRAVAQAKAALAQGADPAQGRYLLEDEGVRFGAGVAKGTHDLVDGAIAFSDGERTLVYRGFRVQIDEADVRERDVTTPFASEVTAERGALKIKWTMPGVVRTREGHPRFTRINLGGCSEKVFRAYYGFGNVIERPGTFTISAGGFTHNTRHVGADYDNGLSLVQATDTIQQKPLVSNRDLNLFSTVTGNDATFILVPGAKGAFEAARRFRAIAGYRKSPGHDALTSRVCLDRWFCYDYEKITRDVKTLARYGVTDCVYVKHDWRRWAWDFADPEDDPLLPGRGSHAACVKACQDAGMLYVPHDNYIDFYPTNPHYSYDDIVFNLDGSPQVAFYVPERNILSYRWNPEKPFACLKRNMDIIRRSYAPDGIFLDVYTAHCPTDYLDREGAFHTREEMSAWWGKAHRACLDRLGKPTGPALSEAGQDHLIGVIDGGQSDHFDARRMTRPSADFADAELVPWHDMVSHGYFTLFAGGLEYRYAARENFDKKVDAKNHGYGTDDYLSNTLIGGRNPMALGAAVERTVHTYWMLHDICASLAKAELVAHAFGENIHRQHTMFSNGAEVWTNRGSNDVWKVCGSELPQYGFLAKAPGGLLAASSLVDGRRVAFARGPDSFYLNAHEASRPVTVWAMTTARAVRLDYPEENGRWTLTPVRLYQTPFSVTVDLQMLGRTGTVVKAVTDEDTGRPVDWRQDGEVLSVTIPPKTFRCLVDIKKERESK